MGRGKPKPEADFVGAKADRRAPPQPVCTFQRLEGPELSLQITMACAREPTTGGELSGRLTENLSARSLLLIDHRDVGADAA